MDFIYDPSLALYLPLYELDGASFASRDAYGHTCTVTGATWRPNGRWFDGIDDGISCGNSSSLNAVGAITIEAWIQPGVDFTSTFRQIVDKRNGGVAPTLLWHNVNHLIIYAGGYAAAGGTTSLTSGIWYHIAGVAIDGTSSNKVYLNGEDDTASTATASFVTNTANLVIGEKTGGGNFFKGLIGEVRIYNRALTPLEIQHNYLATKWRYR